MKWTTELNGQGAYWWKAETPLGPVYAEWQEPRGWYAYWHPYDADKETPISGGWDSQETAKGEAEKWIRAYARKLGAGLVKFGKAK